MIYLTGENVFAFNSGTEFSQFERLRAFNEQQWPTKLLLRNYNRFLARDLATHHLEPAQVVNMYDYFQGTVGHERQEQNLRLLAQIPLKDYHIVGIDNNTSELRYQGVLVGKINVMPETVGLVGEIEYYDSLGHVMLKQYWDWRGFCSLVETYHPDGNVATKQFLRLDGSVALEVSQMYRGTEIGPTSWKLCDYFGKDYMFDTEDQLYTFFLNEMNAQQQGVFISDRRTLDGCVAQVIGAKAKLAYLHSSPFGDVKRPKRGILPIYREAFRAGDFDQVIFPTATEVTAVSTHLGPEVAMLSAPDSYVEVTTQPKTLAEHKVLVYVGRLAEDKNITDLLRCFKAMHTKDHSLVFKLQGYFSSSKYQTQLQQLVTELKLQQAVEFVPYNYELDLYREATLFLNASFSEGFGMNMLESMAQGVPVVSYVLDYTENNLLKDGENGGSVRNKTPKMLANKALELLSDAKTYQALSAGALKTAQAHTKQAFLSAWAQILG